MAKTGQRRRGGSEGILYYDPAFELSSKISIWINRLADNFFPCWPARRLLARDSTAPDNALDGVRALEHNLHDYFPGRNLPVIFLMVSV